jgi:hypothetical protein
MTTFGASLSHRTILVSHVIAAACIKGQVSTSAHPLAVATECTKHTSSSIQGVTEHKGKGKGHPRTGHEGPEGEYRYSTTLSLTSALDGVG